MKVKYVRVKYVSFHVKIQKNMSTEMKVKLMIISFFHYFVHVISMAAA